MLLKPNVTRWIGAIFSMVAVSDFVHNIYSASYNLSARSKPDSD